MGVGDWGRKEVPQAHCIIARLTLTFLYIRVAGDDVTPVQWKYAYVQFCMMSLCMVQLAKSGLKGCGVIYSDACVSV